MRRLLERLGDEVNGVVSGWDRLALRGTIRWLASAQGLASYLVTRKILFKDFGNWAQQLTKKIRDACSAKAQELAIRTEYLTSSAVDKEARAAASGSTSTSMIPRSDSDTCGLRPGSPSPSKGASTDATGLSALSSARGLPIS